MKLNGKIGAFTLVEIMVAGTVACFVGLIAYGVATDALVAFEKNFSINRSYGDARRTLDRLTVLIQSAGHVPVLIDATGADTTTTPAAGVRFWRYSSTPLYLITTAPTLTTPSTTVFTISLTQPGTVSTLISPPAVGDMVTVAALGFQARLQSLTSTSSSATLTFAGSLASNTSPPVTTVPATTMSCLDWTSVAFIAVGTQLRYFEKFISGTTNVNTAAGYKVVTNLISTAPALPFSLGPSPSLNVDIYAEAPDYNNRNLGTSNTYTYLECALAPRNPIILRSPF